MLDGAPHEYKEKPNGCAYCGNSPVNHLESYIFQTLSVWSSRSGRRRSSLRRLSDPLYERFEPLIFRFLAALPGSRFSSDPTKAKTYRSQVVWEEAIRRNIRMEQLVMFGAYTDMYRAHIADRWHYFISLPTPPHMPNGGEDWMDDKYHFKAALAEAGIPVPRIESVTRLTDAMRILPSFGAVVVKPRAGSRGRHTTVHVSTKEELARAFSCAQALCRYVAIEEYLEGPVCRATVVNGRLAGFFEAHPPRIVGDGVSTISELVERANASKHERVQNIVLNDEHLAFISRHGFTPESVLPEGRALALTHRTGRLFGGYTRELLGKEHPKLRAFAEQAAGVIGAPIVGFDLIIPNPERDPDGQRWGFIEANSLPYIDLHYLPLEGAPSNVAAAVWNLWELDTRP